ncbi:MAG TPA: hypothetical protein VFD73_02600, partial [Gemmatimonadales bacterium]|nr:hypothetical protein [Gemmatimonadales bacterium]
MRYRLIPAALAAGASLALLASPATATPAWTAVPLTPRITANRKCIMNPFTDSDNGAARAARLLADAERIANSITDETPKAWALSAVASTLAATEPDRAEHIANSITDETAKASALGVVAAAVAATDSD